MPRTDFTSPGMRETLVASAARTTSGDTGPLSGWGAVSTLRGQLNVTAVSGTIPTLEVVIEDTVDGGENWNPVLIFGQHTTTGRATFQVTDPFSDTLRVRWTIGGAGASFTFAVDCYSE